MTDEELVVVPGDDASTAVAQGLRWSALGVVGVRVVNAARGLLIARLVGPGALGLFAAAYAIVSAGSLLADFGLQSYLVHRGQSAADEARVVFKITLAAGVLGALAIAALSVPIGVLYNAPTAGNVALALSVSVLLSGLAVVPNALLRSQLRFREVARSQVGGEIVGLAVGLPLALAGAGVWALVSALLANQLVAVLLVWTSSGRLQADPGGSGGAVRRRALRYGLTVTAGSVLWAVALQGDNVIVGHAFSPRMLGFYAFAYSYGILPGVVIGSMVSDVALASFSAAATSVERRALFLRFTRITAVLGAPIVAIAAATAPDAIRLLLGPTWLPAANPLRILLIAGWIRGLYPAETLLRAIGRVGVEFRIGLVAAPATVFAAAAGATRSISFVALLVGVVLTLAALVSTSRGVHAIGLSVTRALAEPLGPAVPAILLASAVSVIGRASSPAVTVFLVAPMALVVYAAVVRVVARDAWSAIAEVARTKARSATPDVLPPVVVEDL